MSTKRLAVVGCGLRSESYLHELRSDMGRDWTLVGLADPNPTAVQVFLRNYGAGRPVRTYASGPELLADLRGQLDAIIIGSPNAKHRESLVPALEQRLTILQEKPIATTAEDCRAIWSAYVQAGRPPLAVGFVLPYTPFHQKVRQLVDADTLGQILSIDVTESLGAPLSALMIRGWRRSRKMAGPFLLEKCSHDLDVFNRLIGSRARRISSFAKRTRFTPIAQAAEHCGQCALAADCRYEAAKIGPQLQRHSHRNEILELIPESNDLCVFNCGNEMPDHQVVNIEYENGVLASFSVCMDQPRTTRTLRINATQGQLFGDIGLDQLRIEHHLRQSTETQVQTQQFDIAHDTSGHHGGDGVLSRQFKAMLRGDAVPPLAGLREGIEACAIALAAEQSLVEHRVVELAPWFEAVFGQHAAEIHEVQP